jgi:hypothetical protein
MVQQPIPAGAMRETINQVLLLKMTTTRFFSFLILSFLIPVITTAQETVNLVPNHSFEEYVNGCPENLNEMPVFWNRWRNSPDSFSTCVVPQNLVDSLGWAPINAFGYQLPFSGEAYVGLMAFGPSVDQGVEPDYREYIGIELIEPLASGIEYFVHFRSSVALNGFHSHVSLAASHLGVIFTTQGHHYQQNPMYVPNFAHIYTTEVITDTANWVTIAGSFIADSAYTHMGIGVFFEFDWIDYLDLIPGPSLGSYYYIDDVCVSPYPDCMDPTTVISDMTSDMDFRVFPNPASEILLIESSDFIENINLYSLDGSLIYSQAMQGSTQWSMDLSGIGSGTYILEVNSNKGVKRERLVVAR